MPFPWACRIPKHLLPQFQCPTCCKILMTFFFSCFALFLQNISSLWLHPLILLLPLKCLPSLSFCTYPLNISSPMGSSLNYLIFFP
jgi:hypothetical protein